MKGEVSSERRKVGEGREGERALKAGWEWRREGERDSSTREGEREGEDESLSDT